MWHRLRFAVVCGGLALAAGGACSPRAIVAVGAAVGGTGGARGAGAADALDAGGVVADAAELADAATPAIDASDAGARGPEDAAAADAVVDADPTLIGYWPLDEAAGARAVDRSGHANHGALQDGMPERVWVPGHVGGAANLAGGAWVRVPASTSIDGIARANAVTMAAWIHTRTFTPGQFNFIVSRQIGNTPFDSFGIALRDGRPTFAVVTDFVSGPAPLPLGRWIHLAATFDGAMVRVYVDGVQVAAQPNGRRIGPETRPVLLGGNQNDGTGAPKEFFEGALDEVRLWSRALGVAEVAALAR